MRNSRSNRQGDLSRTKLSTDGKNWLIGATDAFHDTNYTPAGYPDGSTAKSVVQRIKRRLTITKPSGLSTGDKWDVHVFTAPLLTGHIAHVGSFTPGYYDENSSSLGLGTVNIIKVKSGSETLPTPEGFAAGTGYNGGFVSITDLGNDKSLMRAVGGAMELTNVTSELYKDGSVTVYSQPCDMSKDLCKAQTIAGDQGIGLFTKSRCPPGDIEMAQSNLDARSWPAAEGAYVPFRLDLNRMGYSQAYASPLVMPVVDSSADFSLGSAIATELAVAALADDTSKFVQAAEPTRFAAYETVGAYFTGLSQETVLILDIVFLVEVAPTPANSVLIGLATPPPLRDSAALQLYDDLMRTLPPGTPVKNNASGDWWRFISKAVDFLSPIVSKLGPQGLAVATAANAVKAVGDRVLEQRILKKVEKIEKQEKQTANDVKKISATAPKKNVNKARR